MISMAKMISIISDFSPKELQLLADGLVWFEQAQAERVDGAEDQALRGAREWELDGEEGEQGPGTPAGKAQGQQDCHAHEGLSSGQQHLFDLTGIPGQPTWATTAGPVRDGQRADQQCPLVHLARNERGQACGGIAPQSEQDGNDEFRRL